MGRNSFHAGILDAELFLQKGDLMIQAVDLGLEPNLTILTEGRPGQEYGEAVVAEGQDVQD